MVSKVICPAHSLTKWIAALLFAAQLMNVCRSRRAQTFVTSEPLRLRADEAEHGEVKRSRTINSQLSSKMVAFVRRSVRFGLIRGDSSGRSRSIAMQIRIVRLNRLALNRTVCPLELSLESRYEPVGSSPTARDVGHNDCPRKQQSYFPRRSARETPACGHDRTRTRAASHFLCVPIQRCGV